jgi:chromosome segregation ATPase
VLYLAEVQKQNKGFMGGTETKLKLLAVVRNDQSWSIVSGNESITTEEVSEFGDGALIALNLGVNRQIQGKAELATQKIIGVLQGFSRLLEKTKTQEQEINQWKESLTIQSEELSRREIEMETRLEQLEKMEAEFKQFDAQRQEIAESKAEAERIKAEFEAKSLELEGAWNQLRGEKQQLKEQIERAKVLDPNQAATIQEHLTNLLETTTSSNGVKDKLNLAFAAVKQQQETLTPHWQELESNQQISQKQQVELQEQEQQFNQTKQELKSLKVSVSEVERQLQADRQSLAIKQELAKFLSERELAHIETIRLFEGLGIESSDVSTTQKLDIKALENMPLPDLEKTVDNLKQDLEKLARFVSDQEEELSCQCQVVDELQAKIDRSSEFDRFTLEQELADEKEAKSMLDETLVGQRRSLRERHRVLLQHSRILKRRQGIIDLESDVESIDLEPLKQSLQQQLAQITTQSQQISQEISEIQSSIQRLQATLEQKNERQQQLEREIAEKEAFWSQLNLNRAQLNSQIDFATRNLQPLQDTLNALTRQLEEIDRLIGTTGNPQTAIEEIDRLIKSLI